MWGPSLWRRVTLGMIVGGSLALGMAPGLSSAASVCSFEPSHSWKTTVPGHLAREFTAPFCGSDDLSLDLKVDWKGHKDLVVYLVEPDGTTRRYLRQDREVTASVGGPLEHGSWTVRVWNLSNGSAKIAVTLDFE